MTSKLKPKYFRCNDKKGNLCRVSKEAPVADVAMFCFLLAGGAPSNLSVYAERAGAGCRSHTDGNSTG